MFLSWQRLLHLTCQNFRMTLYPRSGKKQKHNKTVIHPFQLSSIMLFDCWDWNKLRRTLRVLSYLCHFWYRQSIYLLHFKSCTGLANVLDFFSHVPIYLFTLPRLTQAHHASVLENGGYFGWCGRAHLQRPLGWALTGFRCAKEQPVPFSCQVWTKRNPFNNENVHWTCICVTVTASIIHTTLAFVLWVSRSHKIHCVQFMNSCKAGWNIFGYSLGLLRNLTAFKVPREHLKGKQWEDRHQ